MNEELDSQLSAMFDDELHSGECELLARRLSRDEALKARWGRYAVIGAVIRVERGVRLNAPLAGRVNAAISAEPALGSVPVRHDSGRGALRWWQPVLGGALAAGVAAASILYLRGQAPLAAAPLSAQRTPATVTAPLVNASAPGGAVPANASYVTPPSPPVRPQAVPSTQFANYVVAHSMVSSPVAGHNLMSAFITSEPAPAGDVPADSAAHDPRNAQ